MGSSYGQLMVGGGGVSAPGGRRSSATAINHRPPLPPSISARSQSLDELLDSKEECDDNVGVSENSIMCIDEDLVDQVSAQIGDSAARLTKSMEVLLDKDDDDCDEGMIDNEPPVISLMSDRKRSERAKSFEAYMTGSDAGQAAGSSPQCGSTVSLARTATPSEKFCESETITVDNSRPLLESRPQREDNHVESPAFDARDAGPLSADTLSPTSDGEASSMGTVASDNAMSRQNSTTSSEFQGGGDRNRKTFMNRLGKRVKSLIKK